MKKTVLLIVSLLLALSLFACAKPENETGGTPVTEIYPAESLAVSSETLYRELPFGLPEAEGSVGIYTSAQSDSEGEIMWDDSNTFFIKAAVGGKDYVLLEEQTIQLGKPAAEVFFDESETLHIVITDSRTAQYFISEFIYNAEKGCFECHRLAEYTGVNYWGKIQ